MKNLKISVWSIFTLCFLFVCFSASAQIINPGSGGSTLPGLTTSATGNMNTFTAADANSTPIVVKGVAGQSWNLQEWVDSSNNQLAYISASGAVVSNAASFGSVLLPNTATGGVLTNTATGLSNLTCGTGISCLGGMIQATGTSVSSFPSATVGQIYIATGTTTASAYTISGALTMSATGVTTLATVNSNVGTYGSASIIPSLTVNAQGLVTAVATYAASGGGGVNPVLLASSINYLNSSGTPDTLGNIFPYAYVGSGGNLAGPDSGIGVASSLGADVIASLRFDLPPSIPSTGAFTLISRCMAATNTGTAKYTVSDAVVAAASPSAATLNAESQNTLSITATDAYVITKTPLTQSTPTADNASVVAVRYNTSGWTLGQILSCRFQETWE